MLTGIQFASIEKAMPRAARLDVPGILHHVIIRGIEGRDIFIDNKDRQSFLKRLSELLPESNTDCLAWALMPNHAHLLLRPMRTKLAPLMRRLLTGHAVRFNRRYQRTGHLFQNRYKSIVCEEEPYLLELVRYIHLNPLRAALVESIEELEEYPWCGHGVLMGKRKLAWQKTEDILGLFAETLRTARRLYQEFVRKGVSQGRRQELTGGGLKRSLKVIDLGESDAHDDRVLGSGEFVERLRKEHDLSARIPPKPMSLESLIKNTVDHFGISLQILKQRRKGKKLAEARRVICYFAVREMGHNGATVGKMLNMTRSGVSIAAKLGEELVQERPSLRNLVSSSTF